MLTKQMTADLPDAPGVYFFRDRRGDLLYIGKAKSLRKRVRQYTAPPERLTGKVRRLVRRIATIEVHVLGSELEALIAESRFIKQQQPPFNVLLKQVRRFPFIRILGDEPFPRAELCWELSLDGADYFGPFPSRAAATDTLELLHRLYPLRTCESPIRPDPGFRPCFAYHIGRCGAPCAAKTNAREYGRMLRDVRRFLLGDHRQRMDALLAERRRASAALQFERAGVIQARIDVLERYAARNRYQVNAVTNNHLVVVCPAREADQAELFFVRAGRLRRQERVPRVPRKSVLKRMFEETFLSPDEETTFTPLDMDMMNIISQWLYANRARQEIVQLGKLADAECSDAMERVREILSVGLVSPSQLEIGLHAV